jgi:hypothetical protein
MRIYAAIAGLAFFLVGCANNMPKLDEVWEKHNSATYASKGTREYKHVSKADAVKAMIVAFQQLDIIIENSDMTVGLLTGSAVYPKPLDYKELQIVHEVEDARMKSIEPQASWLSTGFENKVNVVFLETSDGVRISIRMKMAYKGNLANVLPVSNLPPKALEIALPKIWNEFEKVNFIQGWILK